MPRTAVLFVCMGNICRSPLAEGLFLHHANQRGVSDRFSVDSAGTGGWHAGERPDQRSLAVAKQNGVTLPGRARQVTTDDFDAFHHLICMDNANREHLLAMGAPAAQTRLLLEYDPEAELEEVPDPYYGGAGGFDLVYRLVDRSCAGLLDHLLVNSE